jgi:hypothetical protein
LESVRYTVSDLCKVASEIRKDLIKELLAQNIPLETYDEQGDRIKDLSPFQKQLSDSMIRAGIEGNAEIGWLVTRQAGKPILRFSA